MATHASSSTKARRQPGESPQAGALLLTRPQVAKLLGVSVVSVDRWTKAGRLPRVELFGSARVLYRRSDVEKLVAGLRLHAASF